jgi:hypothetical protein
VTPQPLPLSIAARLWTWAAALRILKRIVPVESLVRLMHTSPGARRPDVEARLRSYLEMTGRFPRRPPGNCLERSLGAYRILCSAGAEPELVIGVRRGADGKVEGHVWVRTPAGALGETDESLAGFALLAIFDASASRGDVTGVIPRLRFR